VSSTNVSLSRLTGRALSHVEDRSQSSTAPGCVDDVERLARTDSKFLSTLRLVSGPLTQELDASNRIQRAAGVPIRFIDDDWPSCDPKGGGDSSQK
jgi:hypothetical protein